MSYSLVCKITKMPENSGRFIESFEHKEEEKCLHYEEQKAYFVHVMRQSENILSKNVG